VLYCGEVVRPLKGIFAQLGKLEAFDFSRVRVHDSLGKSVKVVSIMDGIKIEKLDCNTIKTKIETAYGVAVYIISGKLTVIKI